MDNSNLKLINFEFKEILNQKLHWEIKNFQIHNFNFFLGDNAQGKTRLCQILKFLKNIHNPASGTKLTSQVSAKLNFSDLNDEITYHLNVHGKEENPDLIFQEEIYKNSKLLFSRQKKFLINEIEDSKVNEPFIPQSIPAINSISGNRFPTIIKLKSFFDRIVFLDESKFQGNKITVDKNAIFLAENSANIASVLRNWEKQKPVVYKKIIKKFEKCFSFIKEGSVSSKLIEFQEGLEAPVMVFVDKNSGAEIEHHHWSDGMLRVIGLLTLPETRFTEKGDKYFRPSLAIVEEIENGLDFKSLDIIVNHYLEFSDLFTIFITTHSPVGCNLVDPKFWQIFKRVGASVEIFSPTQIEKDLNKVRRDLLEDNWSFYKNHISTSKMYKLK